MSAPRHGRGSAGWWVDVVVIGITAAVLVGLLAVLVLPIGGAS